ncbi:unnamed protein product, partial [Ectocarpus sp. 12 AP-2014]
LCSSLVPHTHTLSPEDKEPQGNVSGTPRHTCDPAALMGSYHGAPMGTAFPEGVLDVDNGSEDEAGPPSPSGRPPSGSGGGSGSETTGAAAAKMAKKKNDTQ